MDFAVGKHSVEAGQCLGSACKEDQSAYGAVKTMNDAKEYVAWFGVCFFDIVFHCFAEGCVAGLVALNDFTRRFGNNDDVIVFVNDVHYFAKKQLTVNN